MSLPLQQMSLSLIAFTLLILSPLISSTPNQWFSLSKNLTFPASPRFDTISFIDKNFVFFYSGVDSKWKIEPVMQVFDTNRRDWYLLDQKLSVLVGRRDGGALTRPRLDESTGLEHPEVLLLGGIGPDKNYVPVVLKVSIFEGRMEELGQFERQRFSILELDQVYLIIGGRTISQGADLRDVHHALSDNSQLEDELCDDIMVIPKNTTFQMDTWKNVVVDALPPREWAAVSRVDINTGLLFGGVNKGGALNDMYRISYDARDENPVRVEEVKPTSGKTPLARSGHNMVTLKGNVYIVGGEGANGDGMNDVHRFNTTSLTFTEVSAKSISMRPFLGAAIFPLDANTLCIYGGVSGWNKVTLFSGDVNCMQVE